MRASDARGLVVAKAPVPGRAKTRLGERVGMATAADLAAASLLDTLAACRAAFGPGRTHVSLAGDLAEGARHEELRAAVAGMHVFAQQGDSFAERLAHAHAEVGRYAEGAAVVQVGMDTPHADPASLTAIGARCEPGTAVLGPAEDGGWWVLALRDPSAADGLRAVPMSTDDTGRLTAEALTGAGLRVLTAETLCDVDTVEDAEQVARAAPHTHFAQAWSRARQEAHP